jgi:hypothetical protein
MSQFSPHFLQSGQMHLKEPTVFSQRCTREQGSFWHSSTSSSQTGPVQKEVVIRVRKLYVMGMYEH